MASFVDTNIFIHFLLRFDPDPFARCRKLLAGAEEGKLDLETSAMTIAELIWFLARPPVRMRPPQIRGQIEPLLTLRGLRVPEKDLVFQALALYTSTGIGFIDAYNAAIMRKRGLDRIYSYDTDFDSVPGITRTEP